jgi:hypothetical protein
MQDPMVQTALCVKNWKKIITNVMQDPMHQSPLCLKCINKTQPMLCKMLCFNCTCGLKNKIKYNQCNVRSYGSIPLVSKVKKKYITNIMQDLMLQSLLCIEKWKRNTKQM